MRRYRLIALSVLVLGIGLAAMAACAPQAVPTPTVVPSPTTVISTPTVIATPTNLPTTPTNLPATPTANPAPSTAVPSAAQLVSDDEIAAGFDKLFGGLDKNRLFSGNVFVAHNGKVLYEKSFGTTKQEPFAPITSSTKFRIASVTKQFTAAAILKLQTQGKLKIQDNVCKYLEPCPKGWDKVTLHQLLTHTSGIPDSDIINSDKPHTAAELAARTGKLPLQFDPGARFSYSNGGYLVLAAVIEQLSGKTYEAFLRESFFDPLEMNDTGVSIDDALLGGSSSNIDYSNRVGAGALYSTIADLYRWAQALDAWERDPTSEYQTMFQSQVVSDILGYYYGYGSEVGQENGHRYVGHAGGGGGYGSHVARFPDSGLTVIELSNNGYVLQPADMAKIAFGE